MPVRERTDAKGRKRYFIEFQQGGVRVCRRLPAGRTRGEASALEAKLRGEIFRQVDLGQLPELSLEEAILRWLRDTLPAKKDQEMPEINARLLGPFVAGKTVLQAPEAAREAAAQWSGGRGLAAARGRSGVGGYSAQRRNAALSSATINRRLCVLKAAAKHAYKQGWVAENVSGRISLLPEENKREVYLTRAQVKKLAESATNSKLSAAIWLAAYTGLRSGELLAMTPQSLHGDTLHVRMSKTGKPRIVPVPKSCLPLLSALPLGLSYWQLHHEFGRARDKAKLPHVHFHDLRHTCASWLINQGVDLYTVGKILGHSAPITTARYAHLSQATLRKAMARLK